MPDNVSNLNLAKGSASPAEFAISCRGVTKPIAAARRKLPRSIDLEVKRGELLMIVGPSGCGKTSLSRSSRRSWAMIPANAMFLASTLNVRMRRSRLRLSIVQLAARPDRSMECRRTAVDQGGALGAGNSARLSFRQEQTAVLFRFDA